MPCCVLFLNHGVSGILLASIDVLLIFDTHPGDFKVYSCSCSFKVFFVYMLKSIYGVSFVLDVFSSFFLYYLIVLFMVKDSATCQHV